LKTLLIGAICGGIVGSLLAVLVPPTIALPAIAAMATVGLALLVSGLD
jgi:hypothetical protein